MNTKYVADGHGGKVTPAGSRGRGAGGHGDHATLQ